MESDLNGPNPQFTLTCISTGGPATTVTWTRDSATVTQGTQTVLNDPVTAQYTHTLTVTTAGEYRCTVANNKPSSDSASTTVAGKMSAHHCFGMQAKNQRILEHYWQVKQAVLIFCTRYGMCPYIQTGSL